jgi:RNA polymerase sigma-70 factor (ECF subfamily)
MYKTAYQYLHHDDEINDVINDACVTLIGKISVLRRLEPYQQRAYVAAAVRNTALNLIRKRRAQAEHTAGTADGYGDRWASEEDVEACIVYAEQVEVMKQALRQLSDRDREVLTLKYLEGMKDAEISRKLGIGAGSVRPALMRARKRAYAVMNREDAV